METAPESDGIDKNWFRTTCDVCVDYIEASISLVNLAKSGIGMTLGHPGILKAVDDYQALSNPEKRVKQREIDAAKAQAVLAQSEIDSDFRLLHAHSLVGIWGAFDSWVDDVVTGWLLHRPDDLQASDRKLKISCATLLCDDSLARARMVSDGLRESLSYSLRAGVTPIEEFFSTVGLGGAVPQDMRDRIFEAQQIRNVFAHCAGRADDRLVERCPGLQLSVGEPVPVSGEMYYRYVAALIEYVTLVLKRGDAKLRLEAPGRPA